MPYFIVDVMISFTDRRVGKERIVYNVVYAPAADYLAEGRH
jgi:hypothetical protein